MKRYINMLGFYMRVFGAFVKNAFLLSFVTVTLETSMFTFLFDLAKSDILFVKILQAVSYSYDFMDEKMHRKITAYTDNAPYDDNDIDNESLLDIYKNGFELVDSEPKKSGMISLVYLIRHKITNKEYILKVKRKDIDEKLDTCVFNMRGLLRCISFVTNFWFRIDITNTIERHLELLREQLDFNREIENTKSMYSNFEHIYYVKIPKIYEEYRKLNSNYIIMEYIEGRHFSQLLQSEYTHYCDLVAKMGCTSLFVHGESHGDFHAGNLLFIRNDVEKQSDTCPEYQIGVIDFGLTIKLTNKIRDVMLYAAINYRNPKEVSNIVKRYLNATLQPENVVDMLPEKAKANIITELENIIHKLGKDEINCSQEHFYKSFQVINDNLVCNVADKYDIKMTDDFVKLQVASSMSNGLIMQLCDGDYNKQMDKTVKELFHLDLFIED